MKYSIEELKSKKEDQLYDRKSARKDPKGLSNYIVAFANADGGTLVIGVEDNGDITGIDDYTKNVNEILPGIVRLNSMRQVHFSRNPKIVAFLHEYDYVQEFGEGVDRIYKEMERAGLPAPEYRTVAFMLNATIRNSINVADNVVENVADSAVMKRLSATEKTILEYLRVSPELSAKELAVRIHKTPRTIQRNINSLKEKELLQREGSDRNGKWIVLK